MIAATASSLRTRRLEAPRSPTIEILATCCPGFRAAHTLLNYRSHFAENQERNLQNMSVKTKIQWCDSTCNPTMGCDGCELWTKDRKSCYAGSLHIRFGGVTPGYAPTFSEVTLFPGRMAAATRWADLTGRVRPDKPWLSGMPRLIFVSDMSDALSATVPFGYLADEVIANVTSDLGKRHQWLWLTKRPIRMAKFCQSLTQRWPDNLWAGTSITCQATAKRITALLKVGDKGTIRFLSVEPQIEALDLTEWLPNVSWVIQGGESGGGSTFPDGMGRVAHGPVQRAWRSLLPEAAWIDGSSWWRSSGLRGCPRR